MRRQRAVITVFFCLLSVVFISFCFAVVEAVRFSGARAQCANATSLGLWSVFSEYENRLLEDYGLFAVDAAYGEKLISKEKLTDKLRIYVRENENVTAELSGKLPGLLLDPWKAASGDVKVDQYALLSDCGGDYYYQQAVEYMLKTAWADAVGKLKDAYQDAQGMRQVESEYEDSRKTSGEDQKQVAAGVKEAREELTTMTEVAEDGSVSVVKDPEAEKRVRKAEEEGKKKDPRPQLDDLKSGDILKLVCGSIRLSKKKLNSKDLLSKRRANRGVLSLDRPHGGGIDDLLFREYLLDHFRNFKDKPGEDVILYQTEYLIGGKYTDRDNLRKTVRSMLYLREGFNYAFLVTNAARNQEATGLATLIIGWTGRPYLVAAVKHALLLEWAYGESLFDVRILLHGGRVPLKKGETDWHVPLSSLLRLKKQLKKADGVAKGGTTGLDYEDYLRLMLHLTGMANLKKRSLDLVEVNMRTVCGCPEFRADNCVIGMTAKIQWSIPSIMGRVPAALLGTGNPSTDISIEGGFAYR